MQMNIAHTVPQFRVAAISKATRLTSDTELKPMITQHTAPLMIKNEWTVCSPRDHLLCHLNYRWQNPIILLIKRVLYFYISDVDDVK
jgi:thiamine monophosphate synthase